MMANQGQIRVGRVITNHLFRCLKSLIARSGGILGLILGQFRQTLHLPSATLLTLYRLDRMGGRGFGFIFCARKLKRIRAHKILTKRGLQNLGCPVCGFRGRAAATLIRRLIGYMRGLFVHRCACNRISFDGKRGFAR